MTEATAAASPLRLRMIDDMSVRDLSPATQRSYNYAGERFGPFHGRSPDQLGLGEDHASGFISCRGVFPGTLLIRRFALFVSFTALLWILPRFPSGSLIRSIATAARWVSSPVWACRGMSRSCRYRTKQDPPASDLSPWWRFRLVDVAELERSADQIKIGPACNAERGEYSVRWLTGNLGVDERTNVECGLEGGSSDRVDDLLCVFDNRQRREQPHAIQETREMLFIRAETRGILHPGRQKSSRGAHDKVGINQFSLSQLNIDPLYSIL